MDLAIFPKNVLSPVEKTICWLKFNFLISSYKLKEKFYLILNVSYWYIKRFKGEKNISTHVAFPEVKLHPILATFLASYNDSAFASVPNLISTFSPVNDALFTFKSLASNIRRSAGTFSPEVAFTISPGTNCLASI